MISPVIQLSAPLAIARAASPPAPANMPAILFSHVTCPFLLSTKACCLEPAVQPADEPDQAQPAVGAARQCEGCQDCEARDESSCVLLPGHCFLPLLGLSLGFPNLVMGVSMRSPGRREVKPLLIPVK